MLQRPTTIYTAFHGIRPLTGLWCCWIVAYLKSSNHHSRSSATGGGPRGLQHKVSCDLQNDERFLCAYLISNGQHRLRLVFSCGSSSVKASYYSYSSMVTVERWKWPENGLNWKLQIHSWHFLIKLPALEVIVKTGGNALRAKVDIAITTNGGMNSSQPARSWWWWIASFWASIGASWIGLWPVAIATISASTTRPPEVPALSGCHLRSLVSVPQKVFLTFRFLPHNEDWNCFRSTRVCGQTLNPQSIYVIPSRLTADTGTEKKGSYAGAEHLKHSEFREKLCALQGPHFQSPALTSLAGLSLLSLLQITKPFHFLRCSETLAWAHKRTALDSFTGSLTLVWYTCSVQPRSWEGNLVARQVKVSR